jgi:hypothetical protein
MKLSAMKLILHPYTVASSAFFVLLVLASHYAPKNPLSWMASIRLVSIAYSATGFILSIIWIFVKYYGGWYEKRFKQ